MVEEELTKDDICNLNQILLDNEKYIKDKLTLRWRVVLW